MAQMQKLSDRQPLLSKNRKTIDKRDAILSPIADSFGTYEIDGIKLELENRI